MNVQKCQWDSDLYDTQHLLDTMDEPRTIRCLHGSYEIPPNAKKIFISNQNDIFHCSSCAKACAAASAYCNIQPDFLIKIQPCCVPGASAPPPADGSSPVGVCMIVESGQKDPRLVTCCPDSEPHLNYKVTVRTIPTSPNSLQKQGTLVLSGRLHSRARFVLSATANFKPRPSEY